MKVTIRHVVAAHHVADATITDDHGHTHRIGHLPRESWFCDCAAGKRCRHIDAVRDVVVPMAMTSDHRVRRLRRRPERMRHPPMVVRPTLLRPLRPLRSLR